MSDNVDCGDCPNITDGCRGLCEKIDLGVSRWSANWHMQEFYQSKHGDYVRAADYAVVLSQLAALREENADALAVNRTLNVQMDALREDLATEKKWYDQEIDEAQKHRVAAEQRLADAERRNADVEKRAADLTECLWGVDLPGAGNPRLRKLRRALEALNPKPEA